LSIDYDEKFYDYGENREIINMMEIEGEILLEFELDRGLVMKMEIL
jgi:hypothetical protein